MKESSEQQEAGVANWLSQFDSGIQFVVKEDGASYNQWYLTLQDRREKWKTSQLWIDFILA